MIKYIFLIVFSCSLSHFVKYIDEKRAKITFDVNNIALWVFDCFN